MSRSSRYVMLITSLPAHGQLFSADKTPLSRLRMENRLRYLDPQDAHTLKQLTSVMHWVYHDLSLNEAELITRAEHLAAEWGEGFLSDLLSYRLELRSAIAALRRRRRGETAAPAGRWGYGRWVGHIERYWNEPGFRLQRVFPWIDEAERLIEQRDNLTLQRLQLGTVWNYLTRISQGHEFDFEAVVIYVLRWDLIARWTSYQGEKALTRFDQMVTSGLGKHAHLFTSAPSMTVPHLETMQHD
jgi:hypothetical protein